jgi:hypothetical protein
VTWTSARIRARVFVRPQVAAAAGVRDVLVSTEDPSAVFGLRELASASASAPASASVAAAGGGGPGAVLRLHFTENRRAGLRISIPQVALAPFRFTVGEP